jgi:hypothetical protein
MITLKTRSIWTLVFIFSLIVTFIRPSSAETIVLTDSIGVGDCVNGINIYDRVFRAEEFIYDWGDADVAYQRVINLDLAFKYHKYPLKATRFLQDTCFSEDGIFIGLNKKKYRLLRGDKNTDNVDIFDGKPFFNKNHNIRLSIKKKRLIFRANNQKPIIHIPMYSLQANFLGYPTECDPPAEAWEVIVNLDVKGKTYIINGTMIYSCV